MRENNVFGKFDRIELTDDCLSKFREQYPDCAKDAPLGLPNTVVFTAETHGKKIKHNIQERRNLFLINEEEDFHQLCDLIEDSPVVVVDTEFNAKMWRGNRLDLFTDDFKLAGVCISVDPFRGYYVPMNHDQYEDMFTKAIPQISEDLLKKRFNRINWKDKIVIGQNIKIEVNAFYRIGLDIPFNYDTLVGSKLIDNRNIAGLKDQTRRICGYEPIELSDIWKGRKSHERKFCNMGIDLSLSYAASDPVNTFRVALYQFNKFDDLDEEAKRRPNEQTSPKTILERIELPLLGPLSKMEQTGIRINKKYLLGLAAKLDEKLADRQSQIFQMIGVTGGMSLSSVAQKEALFFEIMRLPENEKDDKHRRSTDNVARDNMEAGVKKHIEWAKIDLDKLRAVKQSSGDGQIINGVTHMETVDRNVRGRRGMLPWKFLRHEDMTEKMFDRLIQAVEEEIEFHYNQLKFLEIFAEYTGMLILRRTFTTSIIERADACIDGMYHTAFTQCLNSGRMSCSPNLMNLPSEEKGKEFDIRAALEAPEGKCFVLCDWSAMEMKIAAALSRCPVLTGIVTGRDTDADGDPIDIHAYTASATLKRSGENQMAAYMRFKALKQTKPDKYKLLRYGAKRVNFGILYGITAKGLSVQLKSTEKEAQKFIDAFFASYPGVTQWIKDIHKFSKEYGYSMTALGRYRRLSGKIKKTKPQLDGELKALQNHPIQGLGADFAKICIAQIQYLLDKAGFKSKLCLMIHDELIVICPLDEAYAVKELLVHVMTTVFRNIELDVDAEVKYSLSKFAPDVSKPIVKRIIKKRDGQGEVIYEDGKPIEEMKEFPTPGYIPPEGQKPFPIELCKPALAIYLNELLQPLEPILSDVRSITVGVTEALREQEEIPDDLELIPDLPL